MKLCAGPFHVTYENGFLRYLSYGDTEILRMIYFAFRDENWGTLDNVVTEETIAAGEKEFSIRYRSFHLSEGRSVFQWDAEIRGSETGELSFELQGVALEAVLKNRAGFCIHHPIRETAGEPVEITRADSSKSAAAFPEHIAPDNPFKNLTAMKWRCKGNWYSLDFTGDLFETEDQRNWTDASFKTFCTPLEKPFPVALEKGREIRQKVTFRPEKPQHPVGVREDSIVLAVTGPPRERLRIGTFLPAEEAAMPLLNQLGFCHYRVDIRPERNDWPAVLEKASRLLSGQSAGLELVLHLRNGFEDDAAAIIGDLLAAGLPVDAVALFPEDPETGINQAGILLGKWRKRYPEVVFGIGTDYNFAEINRNRIDSEVPDFVSFGIHPQEHAFDNLSLTENLAAQADTVRTLKQVYGCGARVSPVTLKKRFNPYATDSAQRVVAETKQVDERQFTAFGAVWTLGSIKYLTEGGADSATYFQGTGKLGILAADLTPYPIYDALALYHTSYPSRVLASSSGKPLLADGLFFEDGTGLVWNHSDRRQRLVLPYGETLELGPNAFRKVTCLR